MIGLGFFGAYAKPQPESRSEIVKIVTLRVMVASPLRLIHAYRAAGTMGSLAMIVRILPERAGAMTFAIGRWSTPVVFKDRRLNFFRRCQSSSQRGER